MSENSENATLLVVDDTPENILVLRGALQCDYRVKVAVNGPKALEIIAAGPPDLVLLDIMMPDMDGIEVLRRIRQTRSAVEMPVIMVTAKDETEDIVGALDHGANDYVTKPVDIAVALARIRTHLALKDATRALKRSLAAEKELLERTLAGSVKVMSDTLSVAAPDAFADASKVRDWIRRLKGRMELGEWWELNIAAMLAPLGKIGIPPDVLTRARAGGPLSAAEEEMFANAPDLGRKLIANIPRLNGVAEIVGYADKDFDGSRSPADDVAGEALPLGSRLLKILFDLAAAGVGPLPRDKDFTRIEGRRRHYDPVLLERVKSVLERNSDDTAGENPWIELPTYKLKSGDILQQDLALTNGHVFLLGGIRLSDTHIKHLHRLEKPFRKGPIRFVEPVRVVREVADGAMTG